MVMHLWSRLYSGRHWPRSTAHLSLDGCTRCRECGGSTISVTSFTPHAGNSFASKSNTKIGRSPHRLSSVCCSIWTAGGSRKLWKALTVSSPNTRSLGSPACPMIFVLAMHDLDRRSNLHIQRSCGGFARRHVASKLKKAIF